MQNVPLGRLAAGDANSFVDGPFGSNLKASEYRDAGIPIIRLQNIRPHYFIDKDIKFISPEKANDLARHEFKPGDLVIAKLGDPTGVACIVPEGFGPGRIVADVVRFRGDPNRVDHSYVSRYLNSPYARSQLASATTGTTRQRVNLTKLKHIEIPLPPLAEQKRIAAILDAADALRTKRRESLALLDKLVQSVFLDLFGDPVTNPKGWEMKSIGAVGTVTTGNTPSRKQPENYGAGVEWIKTDNIGSFDFVVSEAAERLSKLGEEAARTVDAGSILVACIAGSRASIGRAGLTDRRVAFNQQINAFTPDDTIDKWYFLGLLRTAQQLIQDTATSSMKGMVSKSAFMRIRIPVPPVPLQLKYRKAMTAITRLRKQLRSHLAELDTLFASLQSRAFRGEL